MSFKDFSRDELFRVAVEDFAVDVKSNDNKDSILAAMLEEGVTWEMYLQAHPEARPEETVVEAVDTEGVTLVAEVPVAVVRTREEPVNTATKDLYLIKMERDNPYFEFRGYKFTEKHPYVVMPARDADAILKREEGFSIASPSEAAAYYE